MFILFQNTKWGRLVIQEGCGERNAFESREKAQKEHIEELKTIVCWDYLSSTTHLLLFSSSTRTLNRLFALLFTHLGPHWDHETPSLSTM